jgi:hypothetical protein
MLDHISLNDILFFDIETVPATTNLDELSPELHQLWKEKVGKYRKEEEYLTEQDHYFNRAGIYAEFGKVVCISVGFFSPGQSERKFRIKAFSNDDEKKLLMDFSMMLANHFNNPNRFYLCGHNIKEFDIPYLCRRMLIHGISLPGLIDLAGKKPWEVRHLDTMELWKFGDYKKYTALKLLTALFNIPTPKDDIDGSQVAQVYWEEKNLERIATYCSKDVVAVAQLLLRFKGQEMLKEEEIAFV